ncbi:alpha-L-fucosidase [Kutzneria buriramensis]|uniref:alpha-L-fucosidase n=1 Tax=Kutzneria buriramensis TaxID=1045776 RepID=UPI0011C14EC8|nr:alpha-L-fucosidase [Kutzneria buriramensis]
MRDQIAVLGDGRDPTGAIVRTADVAPTVEIVPGTEVIDGVPFVYEAYSGGEVVVKLPDTILAGYGAPFVTDIANRHLFGAAPIPARRTPSNDLDAARKPVLASTGPCLWGAGSDARSPPFPEVVPVSAPESPLSRNGFLSDAVPLPPLRVPRVDLGLPQQPNERVSWLQDAKIGLFIHWGVYAGPAQGEWYQRDAGIKPSRYRSFLDESSLGQFTADRYDPTAWVRLAQEMGAKYVVLTARHHDGFGLSANTHPNAWTSLQPPLRRDFVADYVEAVRAVGLKVGLYYSPIDWRYPGYYDVTGAPLPVPPWNQEESGCDHRANARVLKEEVYQAVKQLVTDYGPIDQLWWDGGWLAENGSDAAGAFFWEPGQYRDPANEWPVDEYGVIDGATGRPLGLIGMVRLHQPNIVANSRSGWIGDHDVEEGGSVPTGPLRTGVVEKTFTIRGHWGYTAAATSMSYDEIMAVVVNSLVRNMTTLINVGPDRHGVVPQDSVDVLRRLGAFLSEYGESVYDTRGGPWQPCDGQFGFTHRDTTFYVHLLPGQPAGPFTTPAVGNARVRHVYDVRGKRNLPYRVSVDGRVIISGIDRAAHPQDTVLAVVLDRTVVATDVARAKADSGNRPWRQADLRRLVDITGVRIAWEFPDTVHRYRVEGSTDGATWTMLADRTDNSDTAQVHTLPCNGKARHVRITVVGPEAGRRASIRSFEVFDRPFS